MERPISDVQSATALRGLESRVGKTLGRIRDEHHSADLREEIVDVLRDYLSLLGALASNCEKRLAVSREQRRVAAEQEVNSSPNQTAE
jgi:hypothetical protein